MVYAYKAPPGMGLKGVGSVRFPPLILMDKIIPANLLISVYDAGMCLHYFFDYRIGAVEYVGSRVRFPFPLVFGSDFKLRSGLRKTYVLVKL